MLGHRVPENTMENAPEFIAVLSAPASAQKWEHGTWLPGESRPVIDGFQRLGQQREWLQEAQIPFCPPVPMRQQRGNAGFLAIRRLQLPAAGWASHWGEHKQEIQDRGWWPGFFFFFPPVSCAPPQHAH